VSFRYHDQLALLAFLNESQAITIGEVLHNELHATVTGRFAEACSKYRTELEQHRREFAESQDANCPEPTQPGRADPGAGFEPYLYAPAFFYGFGHSDCIAITLIDDFDALYGISTRTGTPIEQLSLAFCPDLDSLELTSDCRAHLIDLQSLLSARNIAAKSSNGATYCDFEVASPLLVITRYTVGGLAVLGHGLSLQRALFRAMATRIHETLSAVRRRAQSLSSDLLRLQPDWEGPMGDDIDSFRCAFLDTQGATDVATVMFCTNFTTAASVVAALRQLTIGDLINADDNTNPAESLSTLLSRDPLHKRIAEWAAQLGIGGIKPQNQICADNHVIASTYTNLGVCTHLVEQLEPGNTVSNVCCNGYVEAAVNMKVNPGHLRHLAGWLVDAGLLPAGSDQAAVLNRGEQHTGRFVSGRYDFEFSVRETSGSSRVSLVELIRSTLHLLNQMSKRARLYGETDLQEVSTSISVPMIGSQPYAESVDLPTYR
jgi:hypothetical protein